MKKNTFILFASVIMMLSCNDAILEYKWENEQIIAQDTPFSWRNDIPALRASASTQKQMSALDMERIFREDMEDEVRGIPPRFGYKHGVNYNLENSGEWITLPDGSRLWRLTISSPGALSINLLYDKFWIPDGAKFWIYSTDRRQLLCTMTSANNNGTRDDIQGFATGLVFSDQITLEYFLPRYASEIGFISVAYVIHGYRHIRPPGAAATRANFGGAQRCHINVNCPEGAPWRSERNAVALILIDGFRLCTGFLVNTTANNRRPWFMTANHCLPSGVDAVTGNTNLPWWSFAWHFESPNCADLAPTVMRWTTGGRLIANNPISDFALLYLGGHPNSNPRNRLDIEPYFLGWDRRRGNIEIDGGVGIHHPVGDIKKISLSNHVQSQANPVPFPGWTFGSNTLWRVTWDKGIAEGGSSGSPFINHSRRVIGQLAGAFETLTCKTPNPISLYGRFDVSWTGTTTNVPHPDNRRRLGYWLAPRREASGAPLYIDGSSRSIIGPYLVQAGEQAVFHFQPSAPTTWVQWEIASPWALSQPWGIIHPASSETWLGFEFTIAGIYTIEVSYGVVNGIIANRRRKEVTVEGFSDAALCWDCGFVPLLYSGQPCPRCRPPWWWGLHDELEEGEKKRSN